MEKIDNLRFLTKLVEGYSLKGTITNNYLLLDAYEKNIHDGLIYFVEKLSNLYIILDKKEFFQLYYYINNKEELIEISLGRPVVMEILYRGKTQRPTDIITYWEYCGFRQHIVRDIMTASYSHLIMDGERNNNIEIKYADTSTEAAFTKNLIEETFDKYTGDILSNDEIDSFVKGRNVLCAYWKGILSGALQFEIKNNVVWIGHMAISSDFRGQGIAKELVRAYITLNVNNQNTRYQLWVMQNNTNAIHLYNTFGFIYGNKSSASMLKV